MRRFGASPHDPRACGAHSSTGEADGVSDFQFKLSGEQRRLVARVREIVQTEFKPRSLSFMNGEFPWPNIRRLAEIGILGKAGA
jgi:hypothetical protein